MDETPQTPGPRRYKVIVDVGVDAAAPLIGALIKEVEQPKMSPHEDLFRVVFICMQDQLSTICDLVAVEAKAIFIGPYVPEVKSAPAVFKVPGTNRTPPSNVTYLPPQRRNQRGGSKAKDTPMGRAILSLFNSQSTANHSDISEAVYKAGYAVNSASAVLSRLVEEGVLVRVGRGLYRLPTTSDVLQQQADRDPSFVKD